MCSSDLMGFLPDIQRIINLLSPRRQNLMFSATFSDEIRKLAKRFLNEPKLIEVARPNTLAENVEQTVYHVPSEDLKRDAVGALIRERGIEQVIVFSNTKIGAGRLARHLQKEGFLAEAIHGDKSQQERLKTLDGFKAGEIKVLVATDVAARGLDIAELPAVINYDLPHSPEDYVHRIGRTGRAGASGMALSLMVDHDQKALAEIEKLTKRKLDVQELQLPDSARGRGERRSRDDRRGHRDGGEATARSEDSRGIGTPSRSGRDRGSRREGNLRGHAPSAERAARYPAPQPVVDDPLFHAPYVPSEPAAADAPERGRVSAPSGANTDTPAVIQGGAPAAASGRRGSAPSSAIRRPANKLAVLLGGKPGG